MINDLIADLITRIRNAQKAHYFEVSVRNSKFSRKFLDVLLEQGFIRGYEIYSNPRYLTIYLKYNSDGTPTIQKMKKISTKSRRIYCGVAELWRLQNGFGVFIISTSKGLMTDEKARYCCLGGEIIAYFE